MAIGRVKKRNTTLCCEAACRFFECPGGEQLFPLIQYFTFTGIFVDGKVEDNIIAIHSPLLGMATEEKTIVLTPIQKILLFLKAHYTKIVFACFEGFAKFWRDIF